MYTFIRSPGNRHGKNVTPERIKHLMDGNPPALEISMGILQE
jgi:hypothetical protein